MSFHYRSSSTSNPTQTFHVGYSSTNTSTSSFTWGEEISCKSTTWEAYTAIFPAGTKYIAIKYTNTTTSAYLYLDGFVFDFNNPYKTPTNFVLDSYDATSATFSWTAGNNETSWQFAYDTDKNFSPGTDGTTLDITTNPYTISGLTTGITYYAAIRADYGNGQYSEWTSNLSFTPRNTTELTLFDGEKENNYAPINGAKISSIAQTQIIIPSTEITSIQGRQIVKLTFYAKEASVSWGVADFEVYLKETTTSSFPTSGAVLESWGTNVYNKGSLSVLDNKMEIELNTPFNYSSGNLLIGIKQITAGTNNTVTWLGSSTFTGGIGLNVSGNTVTRISYSRKVKITTTPITTAPVKIDNNGYTTFASAWPLDLANLPAGLKAYKAAVSGDRVNFTEINQSVPANTGMLLEGTADETYSIPVAESGTALEDNDFLVNNVGGTFTAENGYTYFGLIKDSAPLTFGVFEPGTVAIPSSKAYLKVANASARQLTCVFGDESLGIEEMVSNGMNHSANEVYNLSGQIVSKPSKGLYIVNGKKYIIK